MFLLRRLCVSPTSCVAREETPTVIWRHLRSVIAQNCHNLPLTAPTSTSCHVGGVCTLHGRSVLYFAVPRCRSTLNRWFQLREPQKMNGEYGSRMGNKTSNTALYRPPPPPSSPPPGSQLGLLYLSFNPAGVQSAPSTGGSV